MSYKSTKKLFETPLEEKDYIHEALKEATTFYQDDCVPADDQLENLEKELYDDLFGFRDRIGDTPRNCPVKYTLVDIFKNLKFGRPGPSQKLLSKFIKDIEDNHSEDDQIWR